MQVGYKANFSTGFGDYTEYINRLYSSDVDQKLLKSPTLISVAFK